MLQISTRVLLWVDTPTVPVNVLINLLTTLNTFGTIIIGKYNVDRGHSHDLSTPNLISGHQ
jgi:hypothetical protein